MGDRHHKIEYDPHTNATSIQVPSIAWKNEYDQKLLLASYPWYVVVFNGADEDDVPQTFTRRFND
jgi:hypothetical protein